MADLTSYLAARAAAMSSPSPRLHTPASSQPSSRPASRLHMYSLEHADLSYPVSPSAHKASPSHNANSGDTVERQQPLPTRAPHASNLGSRSSSAHYSPSPSYTGLERLAEKDVKEKNSNERTPGGMVYSHTGVDRSDGTKGIYPAVGANYLYQHSQLLHDDSDEDQSESTGSAPLIRTMEWNRRPNISFAATSVSHKLSVPQHDVEVDEDMCRPPASEIAREGYLWIQTSLHWKRYHTVATYDSNGIGIIQLYIDEYDQTPNRMISLAPFKSVTPAPASPRDAEVRTGRFEFHLTGDSSGTAKDGDICFAAENHIERNAWVTALKILCNGGTAKQEEVGRETETEFVCEAQRRSRVDDLTSVKVPAVVISTDPISASPEAQSTTIEALIAELMDELKFRTSNLGKMVDRVLKGQANQLRETSTHSDETTSITGNPVGEKLEEMHTILSRMGAGFEEATSFSDLQDKMDEVRRIIMVWDDRRQSVENELKEMISEIRNRDLLNTVNENHAEIVSLLTQSRPNGTTSTTAQPPSADTQTILQTLEPILLEIRARLTIALSRSPSPSVPHSQHTFDRPTSQMIVGMNDKLVRVTKLVEHVADSWEGKVREIQGRVAISEGFAGDTSGIHAKELVSAVDDVEKRLKGVGKDVAEVDSKLGGMVRDFTDVRENVETLVDLLRGDEGTSAVTELKEFMTSLSDQLKDVKDRVMDSSVTSDRLSALISMMEVIQEGVSKLGSNPLKSTTSSHDLTRLQNMTDSIHQSLVSYLPIDLDTKLTSIQHTLTTLLQSSPSHRITTASSSSSSSSSWNTQHQQTLTPLSKSSHPTTAFEQEMTRHAITTSESLDSIQHTLARLVEWFDAAGVLGSKPSPASTKKASSRVVDVTETDEIKDTVMEIKNLLLQDRRGDSGGNGGGFCECGQVSPRELFKMREERDSLKKEIEDLHRERDRLSAEGGSSRARRYL